MVLDLSLVAIVSGAVALFTAIMIYFLSKRHPQSSDIIKSAHKEVGIGFFMILKGHFKKSALAAFILAAVGMVFYQPLYGAAFFASFVLVGAISLFLSFLVLQIYSRLPELAIKNESEIIYKNGFFIHAIVGLSSMGLTLLLLGTVQYVPLESNEVLHVLLMITLGVAYFFLSAKLAESLFQEATHLSSRFVSQNDIGINEDDRRNPGAMASQIGRLLGGTNLYFAKTTLQLLMASLLTLIVAQKINAEKTSSNLQIANGELLQKLPEYVLSIGFLASILSLVLALFLLNQKKSWAKGAILPLAKVVFLVLVYLFLQTNGYPEEFFLVFVVSVVSLLVLDQVAKLKTRKFYFGKLLNALADGSSRGQLYSFAVGLETAALYFSVIAITIFVVHQLAGVYAVALLAVIWSSFIIFHVINQLIPPSLAYALRLGEMADIDLKARHNLFLAAADSQKTYASANAISFGLNLVLVYLIISLLGGGGPIHFDVYHLLGFAVGILVLYFFAALWLRVQDKITQDLILEIRRQFREIPGLLSGTGKPDIQLCVDIASKKISWIAKGMALSLVIIGFLSANFIDGKVLYAVILAMFFCSVVLTFLFSNTSVLFEGVIKKIEAGQLQEIKMGSVQHERCVEISSFSHTFKNLVVSNILAITIFIAWIFLLVEVVR